MAHTRLPIKIRPAELEDVEELSLLYSAAMELAPHWRWRYVYHRQFPEVHRERTEMKTANQIRQSKNGLNVYLVAEVGEEVAVEAAAKESTTGDSSQGAIPGSDQKNVKRKEIAGYVMAQWPGTFVEPITRGPNRPGQAPAQSSEDQGKGSTPCECAKVTNPAIPEQPPPLRADCNPQRSRLFDEMFGVARKRYFDDEYGNNQMYVDLMAVLPKYHRRGVASALLSSVLDLAKKDEEADAVTLFATPMGTPLYKKHGFEEVGSVGVKLEGDQDEGAEGFVTPVMVWKKKNNI